MDRQKDYDPPPFVIVVQGPPGCGKSTLIKSLVKSLTKHNLQETKGPGPLDPPPTVCLAK